MAMFNSYVNHFEYFGIALCLDTSILSFQMKNDNPVENPSNPQEQTHDILDTLRCMPFPGM